ASYLLVAFTFLPPLPPQLPPSFPTRRSSDLYLERSDYTIEYYRRELRKFMHTLEDMRLKTDLRAITGDLIEGEYIRYMSDEVGRSEEHTSELQSRFDLVCRLLLEKKKTRVQG